ncbi:MAG: sulfate/molybdate ABC transporter ATP-binding protein [Oscillospiraceae bacterium]
MSVYVKIKKRLGDFQLDVEFEAGNEVIALLGASGCGKSMTLRCIAGVEKPDEGLIIVDDVVFFDSKCHIDLTPQERRTGLLFQNYALFPNMTARQNIALGAKRDNNKKTRERKVSNIIKAFRLDEFCGHLPSQLSGGQQQRTALARILVSEPRIIMLDEPFSALDSHLKFYLEQEVTDVIQTFGRSVILVSHNRDEVYRMSDSVAVLHDGKVSDFGTKASLFASPKTVHSARLTGCKNISKAYMTGEKTACAEDWDMELILPEALPKGGGYVGIRAHDVAPGGGRDNDVICRVMREIENPFSFSVMLRPVWSPEGPLIDWEMEKDVWRNLRAPEVMVSLPASKILVLK